MLTEIYIEAIWVDEELADQVWKVWDAGQIVDLIALRAWWCMALSGTHKFWCWSTIKLWLLTKNNSWR